MLRRRVPADRPWERTLGYSRAVRAGDIIEVSGTAAAAPDGSIAARGDVYRQTKEALRIIGDALRQLGADFDDVVRTRVFITDVSRWEEAARAHGEVFSQVRPANAVIGVSGFVDPDILVEIEVTAVAASAGQ